MACEFQTVRSRYQEVMEEVFARQRAARADRSALLRPGERETNLTVRVLKSSDKSGNLSKYKYRNTKEAGGGHDHSSNPGLA